MARIDLAGKPICITGASSGIGRATALACAAAGMPVVVSARREKKLRELVDEIRSAGGRAEAVVADVVQDGSGECVVEKCIEAFGSVYAVFANAGYGYESAHHESDLTRVREIFETNLFGTLRVIDAALPGMMEHGDGHVLVCSSCLSALPTPYYSAYSATKSAQHHVASGMRVELLDRGIHISTVHPVGTSSEFRDVVIQNGDATLATSTPAVFMQTPERVARAVVRGLRKPKPEIWTSATARIGFTLAALSPRLRDRLLRSVVKKRLGRQG